MKNFEKESSPSVSPKEPVVQTRPSKMSKKWEPPNCVCAHYHSNDSCPRLLCVIFMYQLPHWEIEFWIEKVLFGMGVVVIVLNWTEYGWALFSDSIYNDYFSCKTLKLLILITFIVWWPHFTPDYYVKTSLYPHILFSSELRQSTLLEI